MKESERLERDRLKRTNRCPVIALRCTRHPTDERYLVASYAGRQFVVGDHYVNGVLGFFIPVGAIIPQPILEDMWLVGRLAGKRKNRVRQRLIGGVTSEGPVLRLSLFRHVGRGGEGEELERFLGRGRGRVCRAGHRVRRRARCRGRLIHEHP